MSTKETIEFFVFAALTIEVLFFGVGALVAAYQHAFPESPEDRERRLRAMEHEMGDDGRW